ncbi:hypothetical protein [Qipengyuania sp. JC766]|uniref:hypothetical protein n=1 Tax=Qipengyuania sp. JC766 TaxID=3232139 RepID=UPI00345A8246
MALVIWLYFGHSSRAVSKERFAKQVTADILPDRQVALSGEILLIGRSEFEWHTKTGANERPRQRAVCDALCAALLANPAISGVTIRLNRTGKPWRFSIQPYARCDGNGIVPKNPDSLRSAEAPDADNSSLTHQEMMQSRMIESQTLAVYWRMRLAKENCIRIEQTRVEPDFQIRSEHETDYDRPTYRNDWAWTFDTLPVETQRFEILSRDGRLIARRSFVSTRMLAWPIHPGPVATTGPMNLPVFGWARTTLSNQPDDAEFNSTAFLLQYTDLSLTYAPRYPRSAIAAELRRLLADSSIAASNPGFSLSETWFRSLNRVSLTDADLDLFVALIEDPRVTNFYGIDHAVDALEGNAKTLEAPIKRRLSQDNVPSSVARDLSRQLPAITPLSNAPLPMDLAILNDPERRVAADGLIIEQADYGAQSVPLLLQIIREHVRRKERNWGGGANSVNEINPIDAAMVALCKIGPEARDAVPEIRKLRSTWIGKTLASDRYWHLTLARIGTPLEEIGPPSGLNQSPREYAASLRKRVENYRDGDCKEMWI